MPGDRVIVEIAPIIDAPVAVEDFYTVYWNEETTFYAYEGVLSNDEDVETPPLSLHAERLSTTPNGDLHLYDNGWFSYEPHTGFLGFDTFTYWAHDDEAYSNPVTVTIEVVVPPESSMMGVPEPSAIALLATMLLGLVAFRRHKPSK